MIATVYKIQSNLHKKRCYIGVTSRPHEKRWYEHKRELLTDRHHNQKLQRYYNKYGDRFDYEVVEQIEVENDTEMLNLEIKYIEEYNSFEEGFNLTTGGMGATGWINPNRKYSDEIVLMLLKLDFFKIYDLKLLEQDFGVGRHESRNIMNRKSYKFIKMSFDSYEDYENHKNLAERYRYPDLGDKINYLYNYMKNSNELEIPRNVRAILRPEGLVGSYLKDDYEYKEKIQWILETVEKNKELVIERKSDECHLVLSELYKCNNSTIVAKKLNMLPEKVNQIKNGRIYPKFHKELREKVKSLPQHKEGRFYEITKERLIYTILTSESFKDAAKKLGVKHHNIANWCKIHELPTSYINFTSLAIKELQN